MPASHTEATAPAEWLRPQTTRRRDGSSSAPPLTGMNKIIRAWKDAKYRATLSQEEQAQIPANPAGEVELSDAELGAVSGGRPSSDLSSMLRTCTSGSESCCC